ncbi:hypothetical protein THAOC_37637, partial [Thalassiosira oceanica]
PRGSALHNEAARRPAPCIGGGQLVASPPAYLGSLASYRTNGRGEGSATTTSWFENAGERGWRSPSGEVYFLPLPVDSKLRADTPSFVPPLSLSPQSYRRFRRETRERPETEVMSRQNALRTGDRPPFIGVKAK